MSHSATCFIDMPFGKKVDLTSGTEIDFDHIYQAAIKPAIEEVGLEPVRGDEEQIGGIIHGAMFARLLLAEYVVADLTLANPNVFYELGIRHAAKPFTTVPIFANVHPLPFDVAMIRALVYQLEDGKLTDEGLQNLKSALKKRLEQAIHGAAVKDSPLFQLISGFPGIELPHEVTDAFQERVRHEEEFRAKLAEARAKPSNDERRRALLDLKGRLGELKTVQRQVLVSLLLAFRAVEAWDEMVDLCEAFPDYVKSLVMVRQQWALALNRRNRPGDRERAVEILEKLVREQGADPETLGIIGRVHKDRYREAKAKGRALEASAALDDAITAYTGGFESDPRDYYPGVNAVNLLIQKGDPEALEEARRLAPLVSFAVARRGGAASSDYWDLATVLELACIGEDWKMAARILPRVLAAARESWMPRTTLDNLGMLRQSWAQQGKSVVEVDEMIGQLKECAEEMKGEENVSLT